MARDEERLVVLLEARVNEFEKRMAKAEKKGTKTYTSLQRRSRSASRQMEHDMSRSSRAVNKAVSSVSNEIGTMGKAFLGGFLGATLFETLKSATREVRVLASEVAEVGNQARRAGLSASEFQEWAYVAQQNRIGVDSLTDGLKELSLRADEFATTGKGSGAEAFERLGYSADELAKKLEDPSELMLEILGRLEKMDKAAQIRIADEVFGGTGGERFVELLDQGAQKIRATKQEATGLGMVMSDELIAKAEILDQQFNRISRTVGTTLKSAIISAAYSLSEFIDGFRAFEQQRTATLESRQSEIMAEKARLHATDQEQSSWSERKRSRTGIAAEVIAQQIAALDEEENKIIAILSQRNTPQWTPESDTWTPPPAPPGGTGGRSSASSSSFENRAARIASEAAALEAQATAYGQIAASGRDYADAMELARVKAELLAAAQADGVQVTPEMEAQIELLAKAYVNAANAADNARQKIDQVQSQAREGADALADVFMSLTEGIDGLRSALATLLRQIGNAQISKLIRGLEASSGGGGLLGSLFAEGGYTGDGGTHEPAGIVHRGEYVFSKRATRALGAGNLHAIHERAKRGYASGGYVGRSAGGASPRAERLAIHVTAAFDESGNAYVKNVARNEAASAAQVVRAGVPAQIQQYNQNPRKR
ncbi:phage tail tape measure protein [Celeribacter indicus]|uniref:Phage tail tape measure protein domain-containing protein n=2 Tax=Celeribacter indicus TaxID=1208324 RepID=A0A0B5E1C3_9RHOB|nr:phage tail tape measure protein [Celeribacter indicus]AJE47190.1 hypothetical protein P73_2475 [Celeribacter indicus]SDW00350.1 phage tail tape measure protein, lambda family [Celeribacter indicus]